MNIKYKYSISLLCLALMLCMISIRKCILYVIFINKTYFGIIYGYEGDNYKLCALPNATVFRSRINRDLQPGVITQNRLASV